MLNHRRRNQSNHLLCTTFTNRCIDTQSVFSNEIKRQSDLKGNRTFGICLGHQLLALSLGATTWKLKFGHRGSNQPVRNLLTGRVEITSQNHGFCVDEKTLRAAGGEPTHVHLNDGTLAGFRHVHKPIFCVQYHPEASPGPHDSSYLFDCFIDIMQSRKPLTAEVMEKHQSAAARAAAAVGAGGAWRETAQRQVAQRCTTHHAHERAHHHRATRAGGG
ncbi:MAG: hypothetical protein EBR07_11170 [Planctomycetes bacterium]|nr:hypothetical protein [Planctomycetota bacterium]